MRAFAALLISLVLFSCGVSRNQKAGIEQEAKTEQVEEAIIDTQRIVGVVRIVEGCGVLIDAKIGERDVVLMPNNLDEKFQKEGMKIKFFFLNSSMPVPKGCIASGRGNVAEVTPLR